jgi:serine/threonine protein kinase
MPLVIKMMKGEHDVDARNMDRHRRDALSMERLTASPNIVSIYGHCGNTVLTEYLPRGLDTIVYNNGDKKQTETVATRQTPLGRLRLALGVARGVAAIHDLHGGPIIHADIQAKQFLVDSHGVVKLNDFNR